jgi:hypothetical protein
MVDIQALIAPGQAVDDLLAHGLDLLTRDHFNKVFEEAFRKVVGKVCGCCAYFLLALLKLLFIIALFHML